MTITKLARAVVLATLAFDATAHAQGNDGIAFPDFDAAPRATVRLGEGAKLLASCHEAKLHVEDPEDPASRPVKLELFTTCFGNASEPQWNAVRGAAEELVAEAKVYYGLNGEDAPASGPCRSEAAEPVPSVPVADAAAAKASAAVTAAEADVAAKQKPVRDLTIEVTAQQAAVDAAAKLPPNRQTQALVEKLASLTIALRAAEKTLADAAAGLEKAKQAAAAARETVTAAKARVALATSNAAKVKQAIVKFRGAIDAATSAMPRSPADFEAMLDDSDRLKACLAVRKAELDAFGATELRAAFEAEQKRLKEERAAAHRLDLLRKAEDAVSGAFSGSGNAERPGAPDKVIFSLMSALGADARTNGTQLVMTLNLASLLGAPEEERRQQPALWRTLTLRANLPLGATDDTPVAGAGTPTQSSDATSESKGGVTRFSAVLGGSASDDTDPRLKANDGCYGAALAYSPFAEQLVAEDERAKERLDYYDVCHRRAANSARFAWRFGTSFITAEDAGERTKLELLALAAVVAPTSHLYLNGFFQHVLEPRRVDVYGVGVSFAGNVGGRGSGVDSWARLGLDVLALYAYTYGLPGENAFDNTEFRLTPNIRMKVLGNSVARLGVGPRILGRDAKHPAVLASVSLSYDADAAIDALLVAPAASSSP